MNQKCAALVVMVLVEGRSGGGDGSILSAKTPLMAAAIAPTMNAGKFPPPKRASHGPLATETTICFTFLQ